jgi:hypothetical protein
MFEQNVTIGPGTGTFASHTFEILVMLAGSFLLGVWLGWVVWSRYRQQSERLALENEGLQATADHVGQEYQQLKHEYQALEAQRSELSSKVAGGESERYAMRLRIQEYEARIEELERAQRQTQTKSILDIEYPGAPSAEKPTPFYLRDIDLMDDSNLEVPPPPLDFEPIMQSPSGGRGTIEDISVPPPFSEASFEALTPPQSAGGYVSPSLLADKEKS